MKGKIPASNMPHVVSDPFDVLADIDANALDIVHRDQADNPGMVVDLKHRVARDNYYLALSVLSTATDIEQQGLTPEQAYLAGFRDSLALLHRHALLQEVELTYTPSATNDSELSTPTQEALFDDLKAA